MTLKEQFLKEYFDKAEAEGLKINGMMFIKVEQNLYIEWLEKKIKEPDDE